MEFATRNEAIDSFTSGDQRVDVIGYVETIIEKPPTPMDNVRVMFTLNNNRGRTLLICVWNQASKIHPEWIKPNAILHIINARCKIFDVPFVRDNINSRINGEAFEIHVNHPTSIIKKIGDFNPEELPKTVPPTILWNQIRESDGQLVRLKGFVKGEFAKLKHCTYGSITDGRKKLNIVLTNTDDIQHFKIGDLIEVEGTINMKGYRAKWYGRDPPGIELNEASKIKKVDVDLSLLEVLSMDITQYP
ncbi:uncharacterized protein LOC135163076 [Diachasmimorpha longicaudata]|uniref:uncharacterized protein LOC135163076 n=1 Tax=Diachasmimorpha longicaudata TaxID=58733 RepID=UPI0030B8BEB7